MHMVASHLNGTEPENMIDEFANITPERMSAIEAWARSSSVRYSTKKGRTMSSKPKNTRFRPTKKDVAEAEAQVAILRRNIESLMSHNTALLDVLQKARVQAMHDSDRIKWLLEVTGLPQRELARRADLAETQINVIQKRLRTRPYAIEVETVYIPDEEPGKSAASPQLPPKRSKRPPLS